MKNPGSTSAIESRVPARSDRAVTGYGRGKRSSSPPGYHWQLGMLWMLVSGLGSVGCTSGGSNGEGRPDEEATDPPGSEAGTATETDDGGPDSTSTDGSDDSDEMPDGTDERSDETEGGTEAQIPGVEQTDTTEDEGPGEPRPATDATEDDTDTGGSDPEMSGPDGGGESEPEDDVVRVDLPLMLDGDERYAEANSALQIGEGVLERDPDWGFRWLAPVQNTGETQFCDIVIQTTFVSGTGEVSVWGELHAPPHLSGTNVVACLGPGETGVVWGVPVTPARDIDDLSSFDAILYGFSGFPREPMLPPSPVHLEHELVNESGSYRVDGRVSYDGTATFVGWRVTVFPMDAQGRLLTGFELSPEMTAVRIRSGDSWSFTSPASMQSIASALVFVDHGSMSQ